MRPTLSSMVRLAILAGSYLATVFAFAWLVFERLQRWRMARPAGHGSVTARQLGWQLGVAAFYAYSGVGYWVFSFRLGVRPWLLLGAFVPCAAAWLLGKRRQSTNQQLEFNSPASIAVGLLAGMAMIFLVWKIGLVDGAATIAKGWILDGR